MSLSPVGALAIGGSGVQASYAEISSSDSLDGTMANALGTLAAKASKTQNDIQHRLADVATHPEALIAVQRDSAEYFIRMSLFSALTRKACATVEMLLKT